jgi:hypothetical protein
VVAAARSAEHNFNALSMDAPAGHEHHHTLTLAETDR